MTSTAILIVPFTTRRTSVSTMGTTVATRSVGAVQAAGTLIYNAAAPAAVGVVAGRTGLTRRGVGHI
jgi:hypothetical protein